MSTTIDAVIFDMDGLLVDSEVYWEESRREFCQTHGCDWSPDREHRVKGMNSAEWAAAIATCCDPGLSAAAIIAGVTTLMRARYDRHLPLLPGAVETVRTVAGRYPLAVASSSPAELIEWVIHEAGIRRCFRTLISADSIGRGKPAPDVFLAAARALGSEPQRTAVFEDSTAGILAGLAAGMRVIAVPNPHYPPDPDTVARAFVVLPSLKGLDLAVLT